MSTLQTRGQPLALCLWLAGCGSFGHRADVTAGGAGANCDGAAGPPAPAHALLRVGCDGELLPGRATWSVDGAVVTLEFGAQPAGAGWPTGADLVRSWPPLGEPPWLGHRVEGIKVEGDRLRVEFAEGADDPARLFADLRLSGVAVAPVPGDARDAIDSGGAGTEVLTHHDASIEYARSLGRTVRPLAFDRLYAAIFARRGDVARDRRLAEEVARDWVGWGVAGARRPTALRWASLEERCGGGGHAATSGARSGPRAAISHPAGDPAARQLAERLVSAGMRGGAQADAMTELTGSEGRLSVRAADGGRPVHEPGDVAAVVVVHTGPGHPCSLHAELLRLAAAWGAGAGTSEPGVLLFGEAATFLVAGVAGGARREPAAGARPVGGDPEATVP